MIELARAIRREIDAVRRASVRYRTGVVTDDSPLSVALGGADEPYVDVKRVEGSTLTVGMVVAVLMFGNDLIVLGEIT